MRTPSRRRLTRCAAFALLASCAAVPSGCCGPGYVAAQPGYVAAQPGCPPMASQPATVRYGDVCQAPSSGSSAIMQAAPSRAASMADAPRPRVVVSEPSGRLAGRSGWRRSDPEGIATRLEGNVDDESVRR